MLFRSADIRVAGRDDRQGGAARVPNRRGAGELQAADRTLEGCRDGEGEPSGRLLYLCYRISLCEVEIDDRERGSNW